MVNVALPENGFGKTNPGLINSETHGIPVLIFKIKVSSPGKVTLWPVARLVAVTLSIRVAAPVPVKVTLMFWAFETKQPDIKTMKKAILVMPDRIR